MLDPRKPVRKAAAAPASDTGEPRWGVPRKMMAFVSSTMSSETSPGLHRAFEGVSPGQATSSVFFTSLMMIPPKLWPMKRIGTRYRGVR